MRSILPFFFFTFSLKLLLSEDERERLGVRNTTEMKKREIPWLDLHPVFGDAEYRPVYDGDGQNKSAEGEGGALELARSAISGSDLEGVREVDRLLFRREVTLFIPRLFLRVR